MVTFFAAHVAFATAVAVAAADAAGAVDAPPVVAAGAHAQATIASTRPNAMRTR